MWVCIIWGSVALTWSARDALTAADVLDGDYTLLMERQHRLEGRTPTFSQLCQPLHSPMNNLEFPVYWYSSEPFSRLDRQFFLGKRIGILDDKVSHTHYLIPLTSLADYGVHQDEVELVHFYNTERLYEAFKRGDIAMISSGDWLLNELDRHVYRSLITKDVGLGSVYVKKGTRLEVQCELLRGLQPFYQSMLKLLKETEPKVNKALLAEHCQ